MIVAVPPPPLTIHPLGTDTLAERSGSIARCIGIGGADLRPDEVAWSPGCHSLDNLLSMGLRVELKRFASPLSMAASTWLGPDWDARINPATCFLPWGWLVTVKKTASVFEPRTLNTCPTCGFSPQLFCTVCSIEPIATAVLVALTTP